MHPTLQSIRGELDKLIAQVRQVVPNDEPLSMLHGTWASAGLTRAELIEEAQTLADAIDEADSDDVGDNDGRLKDYTRRLNFLRVQTVGHLGNGNVGQAVVAYMLTLQGLRNALEPVLGTDKQAEAVTALRKLTRRLRSMEAQLNELEPRAGTLADKVDRIERAHDAADQLPTDLESLSEARQKIGDLLRDATKDQARVTSIREGADEIDKKLKKSEEEAQGVLTRCETAYSAATSVGLAAAFDERSNKLATSMWFWILGLVIALAAAGYFGSHQLRSLSELLKPGADATSIFVIVLNLFLSVLSVAAPVWFAWLATKQIGHRFRLAEDYAYKASIARAYEGFRRETARVDKEMEARLLGSALTRLDELPLRLVENESHGSPWHELASSPVVKQAVKAVPEFAEQVRKLAADALRKAAPSKGKPAAEDDE